MDKKYDSTYNIFHVNFFTLQNEINGAVFCKNQSNGMRIEHFQQSFMKISIPKYFS